jgi:hypothetical protein
MSDNSNIPSTNSQNNLANISSAKNLLDLRNTALKPLSYAQRVTSYNPCAFVLLVDQSGSMSEEMEDNKGKNLAKSEHLALIVNKFLDEILTTCQRTEGVKNYFEIVIVGYGQLNEEDESIVTICWEGDLSNKTWVSVDELKRGALRTDIITIPNKSRFGPKEIQEPVKIWLEAKAEGLTPMKESILLCCDLLEDWVRNHPNSFPPIVFNITDGFASDIEEVNEIIEAAAKLRSISTDDGNVLFFNCLISENNENLVDFPLLSDKQLFENDEYELALFESSSTIPSNLKKLLPIANQSDEEIKGLVLGSIDSVIRFLNIGTYTLKNISN